MPQRTRSRLRRRRPSREEYPLYLIVCEGAVTERQYFDDLRVLLRIPIHFKFITGASPATLVQKAAAEKKKPNDFDDIWVLFDIDNHPNVPNAKQQARDNDLKVAISNPCFELWALLHFQDQHAYIERNDLRRLLREHVPGYEKRLPFGQLSPLTEDAQRRASALRDRHRQNQMEGANPSTDADRLVETLLNIRPM